MVCVCRLALLSRNIFPVCPYSLRIPTSRSPEDGKLYTHHCFLTKHGLNINIFVITQSFEIFFLISKYSSMIINSQLLFKFVYKLGKNKNKYFSVRQERASLSPSVRLQPVSYVFFSLWFGIPLRIVLGVPCWCPQEENSSSQLKHLWMSTKYSRYVHWNPDFRHCSVTFQWTFSPAEWCWMAGTFHNYGLQWMKLKKEEKIIPPCRVEPG